MATVIEAARNDAHRTYRASAAICHVAGWVTLALVCYRSMVGLAAMRAQRQLQT